MKIVFRLSALIFFFVGFSIQSFAGSAELPSISADAGHIYIANRTNQRVIFYLESKHTKRTEHALGPNHAATFKGAANDHWFNIEVFSNNGKVSYGLDTGTRHYFSWNGNDFLDVYKMSPR